MPLQLIRSHIAGTHTLAVYSTSLNVYVASHLQWKLLNVMRPKRWEDRGTQGSSHLEKAILDVVTQKACQGLEHLPHSAVANHNDAPALQALGKVLRVHRVQLASVWPEDLIEFLQQKPLDLTLLQ